MMVSPAPDVTPKILPTGHLKLSSSTTGAQLRYGPAGTAMWIALNQSAGDVGRAAVVLATMWDIDPAVTHSHMVTWVEDLCDAGLLERATAEATMTVASAVGGAGHDEAMARR